MKNPKKVENILISGGTGLVGKRLFEKLTIKGYNVAILSREKRKKNRPSTYHWDLNNNTIDIEALKFADYIIHLAGANIGSARWTKKRKKEIIDSRVKSAELIFNQIQKKDNKLKAFITASGIGYYGSITSKTVFSESDPPYDDFLAKTCLKWEQSADKFEERGIRTVKIRTGIVLSKHGGALEKIRNIIKLGFGAPLGSGKQHMPWIHIDDLCDIYIKAIEDKHMTGAYNAVAPSTVTNNYFTKTLARIIKKPLWLPNVPKFILKLFLGEMSVILLNGSRISSDKIVKANYKFKFTKLDNALSNLLNKENNNL